MPNRTPDRTPDALIHDLRLNDARCCGRCPRNVADFVRLALDEVAAPVDPAR